MMAAVEAMRKQTPEDRARLKQRNNKCSFVVQIRHVSTPDVERRLSQAVDLLLETASRSEAFQEGDHQNTNGPARQAPDGDAASRGDQF